MAEKEVILELKNVKKVFQKKAVLNGLSITVEKGDVLGIIGPSGCGKSTLFKIILGYYEPTSGQVLLEGKDIKKKIKRLRKSIGYTTQDDSFYKKLTVEENMRYYAKLYGIKKSGKELKKHIHAILSDVELLYAKNRLVETISGGMRRRLNFAISLIHNPDILVLDEPTTGLDPLLVKQFWKVVQNVVQKGKTIIITSHLFPEIEENCTRVAVMHEGAINNVLEVKELKKKYSDVYTFFKEVIEE